MKRHSTMLLRALVVLCLATGSGGGSGSEKHESALVPEQRRLAEIQAAWRRAGARVGWCSSDPQLLLLVIRESLNEKRKGGEIPGFALPHWRAGVVAKLPLPPEGFVLVLSRSGLTDEGLKELAGLKQLRLLGL